MVTLGNNLIQEAILNKGFYSIAEVGLNHGGSIDAARKLIDLAHESSLIRLNFNLERETYF